MLESRDLSEEPPEHLSEQAGAIWRQVVRSLADARVLDRADAPVIEAFCVQLARMRQAQAILDQDLTREEQVELEGRIRELTTILAAAKGQLAGDLRTGARVRSASLNALAELELRIGGLEAYLAARRAGGNRVALGSTGNLRPHPMLAVERAAAAQVRALANDLAMTPPARAELGLKVIVGRSLQRELDDAIGAAPRR